MSIRIQFTNSEGETEFIERDATVKNKAEAKALLRAVWTTYKSSSGAQDTLESLKEAEDEHDYYTINSDGRPNWY